jgi:RNA polymerase sigma factor (sigma-70 family)
MDIAMDHRDPVGAPSAGEAPPTADLDGHHLLLRDDSEFDEFFKENFGTLTWFATYMHRVDEHLARDIAQDAMIEVLRKWRSLQAPLAFARYAVYFRGLDRLRKAQGLHHHWQVSAGIRASDLVFDPGPGETFVDSMSMIRRLPPRQAAVFALHFDGCSTTQISSILKLNEQTVRSTLRHARERLKKMWLEEYAD